MSGALLHSFVSCLLFAIAPSAVESRAWSDPTGAFLVQGAVVATDDVSVVIERPDGELLVLERAQLAPADQKYLAAYDQPRAGEDDAARFDVWTLYDGTSLRGESIGFGSGTWRVNRERGDILLGGRKLQDLPRAYTSLLMYVVAQADGEQLDDRDDLQRHLADQGGGPLGYDVEGLQVLLPSGDQLTIPLGALERNTAAQLAPGLARWNAAQGDEVQTADRDEVTRRERLMIEAYRRRRGSQQERQLRAMHLQLQGAEAGVTEIWEVMLEPPTAYGYPLTVVVPGQSSAVAGQLALQRYPGWRVAGIRKLNHR